MSEDTITIEVDGKTLQARKGQMLIEVTDANNIYIPRFCYHHKLTVAANCRMCLIEVEKVPKPLPACATPVMDGMKAYTKSPKAKSAQKAVMEFLLINHPLDCPICDQGGECELQDLAMGYGRDISRYQEKKRVVKDKNIGPLVQTDMTRCIHCTRCVRFGDEIAGLPELGATGRGEHMEIGTYIEKSMVSEMSGNVIDLCPVGALTSKPFRFSARTWEMVQWESIAPHDAVGSNIQIHTMGNRVKRVVPAENEQVNEVWLSDRDRFSYEGLYNSDRLLAPMIKQQNKWLETDWETALEFARDRLQGVINTSGADNLGVLASPASTLEELYLLQKLARGLGCSNIDHRIRQRDFCDQDVAPVFPWLGQAIVDLEQLDTALLVGSNVRKEQPIINHRLRKAALHGSKISVLNPIDYEFNYDLSHKFISSPVTIPRELAAILKAVTDITKNKPDDAYLNLVRPIEISDEHRALADELIKSEKGTLLLGNLATAHPEFSTIRALAGEIAKSSNISFGYLCETANSSGAWLSGVLPHRGPAAAQLKTKGLDAYAMLDESLKAYILLGLEPELDCWDGNKALQAMRSADFVISLTPYRSKLMDEYADVILPIALFAETSGTYINNEGRVQSFNGVVNAPGEARPAWKILRVMGNLFNLENFEYESSIEVRDECQKLIEDITPDNIDKWSTPSDLQTGNDSLQRITDVPMYAIDPLTRHAESLQQTNDIADGKIHISTQLAQQIGVANDDLVKVDQDECSIELPVLIDDRIPAGCIHLHAGQTCHAELGAWSGNIKLTKS